MASYVENYCNEQMPPPYTFRNVRIWSFPLLASYIKVQELVSRYLRPGDSQDGGVPFDLLRGGSDVHAATSLVYMMVLDYGRMACAAPPGSQMGSFRQREYLFGIPVIGNFSGKTRIAFFCPFIFVDCGWSMICGNTVLGYPKQPAWFHLPATGDYPIRIEAPVMVKYSPDTVQSWQGVADIKSNLLAEDVAEIVDDVGKVVEDVVGEMVAWPFGPIERIFGEGGAFPLERAMRDLFRSQTPEMSYEIVQLKQIRNAQFPDQACYRSLLTCTSVLRKMSGFRLLAEPQIRLPSYASLDIAGTLGLFSINGVIRPIMPYTMQCDFDFVDAVEQPI